MSSKKEQRLDINTGYNQNNQTVQGDHIDFTEVRSIYKYFRIHSYKLKLDQNRLKPLEGDLKVKAKEKVSNSEVEMNKVLHIGMDRYASLIVIYDIDWNRENNQEIAIYIIYDRNSTFSSKQLLNDLNDQELPRYLINEIYTYNANYRITKICPYIVSNIDLLKLIQYLKIKLQFYPSIKQKDLNQLKYLLLKNARGSDTRNESKMDSNSEYESAIKQDTSKAELPPIFLADYNIAEILRSVIYPDIKKLCVLEELDCSYADRAWYINSDLLPELVERYKGN